MRNDNGARCEKNKVLNFSFVRVIFRRLSRDALCRSCPVRPHYGLTQGRAVYCVTHKKGGMVHLLKESMSLDKERAERCVSDVGTERSRIEGYQHPLSLRLVRIM